MSYKMVVRFQSKPKLKLFKNFSIFQDLGIILHSDLSWADQVNYTV